MAPSGFAGAPPRSHSPQPGLGVSEGQGEDIASRINVAIRCRPLSENERNANVQNICRIIDGQLVILMDPGAQLSNDYLRADKSREKRYAFDQAFGPEVETAEVYAATAKPLIGAVLQAYNATVFAYGSTGAGKTFTMIGSAEDPGVMLRTVKELFDSALELRSVSTEGGSAGRSISVRCCFLEVYNENLRDLLSSDGREGFLDIREDPERGTAVAGITETEAESAEEVAELLRRGNQRRTTEPTAMNVTSSRSHAVLQIMVRQRAPGDAGSMLGKLSLIDLAGSERASQTDNRGVRLLEGANINRSLLALGNCITALASGGGFVPYRDSKLTRLLKDSLGGNCRTVMVANISPNHNSYEDTLNTLKYANRAKNIRVSAHQNIVKPDEHVSQYEQAIADLRNEVSLLKKKLARCGDAQVAPLPTDVSRGDPGNWDQAAGEDWKEEMVRNIESRTQLQRSLIEIDRGLLQWRKEKAHCEEIIGNWDERASTSYAEGVRLGSGGPKRNLEGWKDQLQQIEESIRENVETRSSILKRLQTNRQAGRDLQAQLPQRVLNEDMRAFLQLIQRSQVLEVERLELDHMWERQRERLEERDNEIAMLRQQLQLRNQHLAAQRQKLSAEQQKQLPGRISMLGATLAEGAPVQERGPLRVMHAWAPPKKDQEELNSWDSRPLRERAPAPANEEDNLWPSSRAGEGIDWRNMHIPSADQIRGLARLHPAAQQLAPKGWRDPPGVRPPQAQGRFASEHSVQSPHLSQQPAQKPATGSSAVRSTVSRTPQVRGSTCPPLRRPPSLDNNSNNNNKGSLDNHGPGGPSSAIQDPMRRPGPRGVPGSNPNPPPGRPPPSDLRNQGLAPIPTRSASGGGRGGGAGMAAGRRRRR